jgi:hypothetical protein
MRLGLAAVLALLSATLPGCFTPDGERDGALFGVKRLFGGPTGNDVVRLCVAVVERPVGDPTLDRDLWDLVDEQVLDSDRRLQLARNGFRVGRFGGAPPPALHALVSSERTCSASPQHIQLRAGNEHIVRIGPSSSQCRFRLDQDGQSTDVELAQALCQLRVVPTLANDGGVTLRFIPFVKHGPMKQKPVAVRTPGGELQWDLVVAQDEETYPWLAWEMTVDANDTVVIGSRPDAADTLGQRSFAQTEIAAPMKRVLVLRASRVLADPAAAATSQGRGVPLAIQAGLPE